MERGRTVTWRYEVTRRGSSSCLLLLVLTLSNCSVPVTRVAPGLAERKTAVKSSKAPSMVPTSVASASSGTPEPRGSDAADVVPKDSPSRSASVGLGQESPQVLAPSSSPNSSRTLSITQTEYAKLSVVYSGSFLESVSFAPLQGSRWELVSSSVQNIGTIELSYVADFPDEMGGQERSFRSFIDGEASGFEGDTDTSGTETKASPTTGTAAADENDSAPEVPVVTSPSSRVYVEKLSATEVGLPASLESDRPYSFRSAPRNKEAFLSFLRKNRGFEGLTLKMKFAASDGSFLKGADGSTLEALSNVSIF
jgi:hypothetical protein